MLGFPQTLLPVIIGIGATCTRTRCRRCMMGKQPWKCDTVDHPEIALDSWCRQSAERQGESMFSPAPENRRSRDWHFAGFNCVAKLWRSQHTFASKQHIGYNLVVAAFFETLFCFCWPSHAGVSYPFSSGTGSCALWNQLGVQSQQR